MASTPPLNRPMKLLQVKTVRFAEVVEKCGAPEVYTLWKKPAADRHFQMLKKNERIMTIRPSEAGVDFGEVGFHEKRGARFMAFDKSLKRFEGKRIVGIKWELLKP